MRERKQKTQTNMQAETRMQKAQVETPREHKARYDNLSQGRQYPGAVSLTRRYPRGQSTTCSTPQVNAVQCRSLCCSMLQRATPCCNVRQHIATAVGHLLHCMPCYHWHWIGGLKSGRSHRVLQWLQCIALTATNCNNRL